MRRFWKRGELDLEHELREGRPEPRDEFVRNVEGRVGRTAPRRGARLVLAAGVTAFALVPFAALGGFGEVADAAKGVYSSNSKAGAKKPKPPPPPKKKQYKPKKVTICHKPGTPAQKTMEVPEPAVKGHLGHGDTMGACPGSPPPPPAPPPGPPPSGDATICHKPGTPAQKTMTVPQSAVQGHLGHGDKMGAC